MDETLSIALVDSSIWVALFSIEDNCHKRAVELFLELNGAPVLSEHAYEEVLNVLRNKTSEKECESFIKFLDNYQIQILMSDEHIFSVANSFFVQHKKVSFSDCLILATGVINDLRLVTFDKELEKAYLSLKDINR